MDPTRNVIALVALEVKRADDLREAESRHAEALRAGEARRVDDMAHLRATYDGMLREAEAKRIDAIRAVDVNAVAVANERAVQQAQVLASQVSASAEQLRTVVATSSAALAQQLADAIGQINTRLTTLERASYEGSGKSSYTDPAMAALLAEVRTLSAARSVSAGTGAGANAVVLGIFGLIAAIGTIVGLVVLLR